MLGDLGYDPVYGARPLKRVIQKQLIDRLALALLDGRDSAMATPCRLTRSTGELALAVPDPVQTT